MTKTRKTIHRFSEAEMRALMAERLNVPETQVSLIYEGDVRGPFFIVSTVEVVVTDINEVEGTLPIPSVIPAREGAAP